GRPVAGRSGCLATRGGARRPGGSVAPRGISPSHLCPAMGSWEGAERPTRMGTLVRSGADSAVRTFSSPDRDLEAVLGRRQRAGPAGIERARRLEGEVEVDDERAGRRVASEIGALGRIDEIAA